MVLNVFAEGSPDSRCEEGLEGTPFGRYRLIELLARGGMGEVWRAYDTATDRVVALKVLPPNLASDPIFEQRFRREAFAAAGLANPHVVPIHNFGEIDGRLYVDMRLIEGSDLQTVVSRGPLDPVRAVQIVDQVASALHAAHRIGLVHRDVKPSNILIDEDEYAYLIDFGIARAAGETKLTGTGSVIGTWAYLAPERVTSGHTDPRGDVYSLACVLHECLTGNQPFPGNSVEQQITGHLTLPPPRPSLLREGVPAQLDAVVATGMAKNPDERFPTTRALARAAQAAIAPTKPHVVPVVPPTEPIRYPHAGTVNAGRVYTNPTRYRPATDPHVHTPVPESQEGPPREHVTRTLALLAGVIVVVMVLAGLGAMLAVQRGKQGDSSSATTTTAANTAVSDTTLSNTGPFTGTYTADFGQGSDPADGSLYENSKPEKETWAVRSACVSACTATAKVMNRSVVRLSAFAFDEIDGRWVAVGQHEATCNDKPTRYWSVISLDRRPDGTLTGQYFVISEDGNCASTRSVTFTRSGDVTTVHRVDDPSDLAPRVPSPAEALHGRYHYTRTISSGTREYDGNVITACLRQGEECISYFHGSMTLPLIFANGNWTLEWEFDAECSSGGTSHVRQTAQLSLPQPPQDPITLLSGRGRHESTGTTCPSYDNEYKFERIGD